MALLRSGKTYRSIAFQMGASLSSVVRWRQVYRKHGLQGLRAQPIPGRPPRLSASQKRQIPKLLARGPLQAGYRTDVWTLKRIAQVIDRRFGVEYHPCHIWRLMQELGWSCQKPQKRARERNEAEIAYWKRYVWPHIKKGRSAWGPSGLPR
jgi:transposase